MSKSEVNKKDALTPQVKRNFKDKAKATGNVILGVGETILGGTVIVGTIAAIAVSCGTILVGGGIGEVFAAGGGLMADGVTRIASPYGNKKKKAEALTINPSISPPSQAKGLPPQSIVQQPNLHRQPSAQHPRPAPHYNHMLPQQSHIVPNNMYPSPQNSQQYVYGPAPIQQPQTLNYGNPYGSYPQAFSHQVVPENNNQRSIIQEAIHKIKSNPWKSGGSLLLTAVVTLAFPPAGLAIGGAIAAGVMIKSSYDVHRSKQGVTRNVKTTSVNYSSPQIRQPHIAYNKGITPSPTPYIPQALNQHKGNGRQ